MQEIQVERVAVKAKTFASGDSAWPVFSNNEWFDLFQERKPEKGEVYLCDVKVTTKDTPAGQRTYRNAYPKPSPVQVEKAKEVLKPVITATKLYPPPNPDPVMTGNKISDDNIRRLVAGELLNKSRATPYTHPLNDYEKLINRGFELAGINGVTDDAARVSLVAILAIAFGEGKLSIDDLVSEGTELTEGWNEALKAGDKILNDNSWADREWFEGPPTYTVNDKQVTKEVFDATTTIKTGDAEMEAAKARMDKYLETVDYKTQLGAAIKTYCFNNKLDFDKHKFQTLFNCAQTMKLETLSQEQAKIAMEKLKVMP